MIARPSLVSGGELHAATGRAQGDPLGVVLGGALEGLTEGLGVVRKPGAKLSPHILHRSAHLG